MKTNRLVFRSIPISFFDKLFGTETDWPEFIKELRGKSGVYVIRAKEDQKTLYIGESHTGRLKKTLLRHFQSWSGKTAGPTYSKTSVEIAVLVTSESNAVETQNQLIESLKPRDNTISPNKTKKLRKAENPF